MNSARTIDDIPWLMRALLLSPAVILVILMTIYPLGVAALSSVSSDQQINLSHYADFFQSRLALRALLHTIIISCVSTASCLALSLLIACSIRRMRRRGLMRFLVTIPLGIPVLIAAYSLNMLISDRGIASNILSNYVKISDGLHLSYTNSAVIFGCTWRYFPYSALLLSAALDDLNPQIEEAATIAGASPLRVFLSVTLPQLSAPLLASMVITFVGIFGTFSLPLIMGAGGDDVLSVLAYRAIEGQFDISQGSTIVVIMTLVQLLLLAGLRGGTVLIKRKGRNKFMGAEA